MKEYDKNRFMELATRSSERWIDISTNFLNINELEEFNKIKKQLPCNYILTGGSDENAERKLVIFSPFYEENENLVNNFISYIKISPIDYKFGEILNHRNYLGALMNLGIERSTIGDILINGKDCYVICIKTISNYIIDNIKSVNRTTVKCEIIESLPAFLKIHLKDFLLSCASNRIDLIISKLYNLSRSNSNELFKQNNVYVNDSICLNNSYNLKENDIISVSGYGRFQYVGINQQTKKGNFVYLLKKYV